MVGFEEMFIEQHVTAEELNRRKKSLKLARKVKYGGCEGLK